MLLSAWLLARALPQKSKMGRAVISIPHAVLKLAKLAKALYAYAVEVRLSSLALIAMGARTPRSSSLQTVPPWMQPGQLIATGATGSVRVSRRVRFDKARAFAACIGLIFANDPSSVSFARLQSSSRQPR